jgi:hypothetical protein
MLWMLKNRGNHPRTEVRGFGKGYCSMVTQVHPDPLVKLVKTRRNPLLRKEVTLQMDTGGIHVSLCGEMANQPCEKSWLLNIFCMNEIMRRTAALFKRTEKDFWRPFGERRRR